MNRDQPQKNIIVANLCHENLSEKGYNGTVKTRIDQNAFISLPLLVLAILWLVKIHDLP